MDVVEVAVFLVVVVVVVAVVDVFRILLVERFVEEYTFELMRFCYIYAPECAAPVVGL